ncbi:MAG: sulfatase-like hydrolase/transferase, partial [Bacteroidales bacterium]|nr:sulfatase-like hydrolase/transferase [Bacteroidales bacterium]
GSYYEGGIREPMFVHWPGKVEPGTKTDVPVTNLDFYPTLLELAEIEKPKRKKLDGQSFLQILTGTGILNERPLFWHFPFYLEAYLKNDTSTQDPTFRTRPGSAIRLGEWKLIQYFENNDIELYNLKEDISEKNNLAESYPEKRDELLNLLENWRQEIHAPVPAELNPEYVEN